MNQSDTEELWSEFLVHNKKQTQLLRTQEENNMAYNAKNAREVSMELLPPDTVFTGSIVEIHDGTVKDFVFNTEKWEGNVDTPAINVEVAVNHKEKVHTIKQVFTYRDGAEATEYSPQSNMGKYVKKYGKAPEKGDTVKIQTTGEGFGRIKIE